MVFIIPHPDLLMLWIVFLKLFRDSSFCIPLVKTSEPFCLSIARLIKKAWKAPLEFVPSPPGWATISGLGDVPLQLHSTLEATV